MIGAALAFVLLFIVVLVWAAIMLTLLAVFVGLTVATWRWMVGADEERS